MTALLNHPFTSAIILHDVLHGFQEGLGTGTDDLKDKIIQQPTATRETVLHDIFMDRQKVYDALDWDKCLEILAGYGVVPRALRLLRV